MNESWVTLDRLNKTKTRWKGKTRKEFNISEEVAQDYYDYLKSAGIVGRMGYVNHEKE